jgi:hypothetical protein
MKRILSLLLLVFLVSCDNSPGSFNIIFKWKEGHKPDLTAKDYYAFATYEEWTGEKSSFPEEIDSNSKSLDQAGPAKLGSSESLEFDNLSYGTNRFVRVLIWDNSKKTGTPLFAGISELFDFSESDRKKNVNISVEITAAPGVDTDGDESFSLTIVKDGEQIEKVNNSEVTLLITAENAEKVIIANDPGFNKGMTEIELSKMKKISGNTYEFEKWNITEGYDPVVDGVYTVFAKSRNSMGYESKTKSAEIVLDTTGPRLMSTLISRVPDFAPARDSENKIIYLSRTDPFNDEPVKVEVTLFSDELLSHAEIAGFEDGETAFSENEIFFSKTVISQDSAGEYVLFVKMKDELGNESENEIEWKIIITDTETVPEYSINMDNILYKRDPWGSGENDFTPVFSLSGEHITDDDHIVAVIVYSSINQLAGSAFLNDEKSFNIPRLSSGNIAEMFIYPVTSSGVKLDPLKVTEVEWTGTFTGKKPYSTNENPNIIKIVSDFKRALHQNRSSEPADVSKLSTVSQPISVSGKRKWQKAICEEFPHEIYSHDINFDSSRGVLVMFGGYGRKETWEFDGKCWEKASLLSSAPFPREGGRIAYNTKDGKTVLFGGHRSGGMMSNEIWEYDGTKWVDLTPSPLPAGWPPIRSHHGWDYNSRTGKFILFGGSFKNDLWEWNGSSFKKLTVADSPSPRTSTDIVYDSKRNVFVLFGGYTFDGYSDETWEFDGLNWVEKKPSLKPPARLDHAAAYDAKREKIVIFGGQDKSDTRLSDTWEWDGMNWVQIITVNSPAPQREAAMNFDPLSEKMVLNGTVGSLLNDSGTWFYDGTDWTPLLKTASPMPRMDMGAAFDRKRDVTVIFGGYNKTQFMIGDTWEWDGREWTEITASTKPSPRYGSRMAFDTNSEKVALFGGYDNAFRNDLWHFDGTAWVQEEHAESIEPVSQHAVADFTNPSGILLFGGISDRAENSGVISDLWNHSSTGFYQYVQDSGGWPERRTHHSMSYDREREVAVVYGGYYYDPDYRIELDETWEFDGSSWKQIYPAENPGKRSRHSSVYDSKRKTVLIFGGSTGIEMNDSWEWDGSEWKELDLEEFPPAVTDSALVYDEKRGKTVLFGGSDENYEFVNKTWELDSFDADKHPAILISVPLKSVFSDNTTLLSITFLVNGGGSGYSDNLSEINGFKVLAWKNGTWDEVASGTGSFNVTEIVEFTINDPEILENLLFGPDNTVNLALIPLQSNGTSGKTSTISIDYFEAKVRYSLKD